MSTCFVYPNPVIQPSVRLIYSISQSNPVTITTTNRTQVQIIGGVPTLVATPSAHTYNTGLIVRIEIPTACGMEQLNNYVGQITVTGPNAFTLDVDSTNFQPFVIPTVPINAWDNTCALIVPIGEDNSMLTEAVENVLG